MISIDENHLRFEFGNQWEHIEKWDDSPEYRNGIHGVDSVRALDIIALSANECLLIEIKDFRDKNEKDAAEEARRPKKNSSRSKRPNKGRQRISGGRAKEPTLDEIPTAEQLVEQVAQKVAGTVAGLVGAARMQKTRFAGDFVSFLSSQASAGRKVRVVLWVEGNLTSRGQSVRAKANLSALTAALKRKVKWLTTNSVQVLSTASRPVLPGVTVSDRRP